MPISVTIPTLGKPKTVKDAVIFVLSTEWPLTARKIYNKVRKSYGMSVTYQAVHKVLKQMAEEGIVTKSGKEYTISIDWLKLNRKFFEKVEQKKLGVAPEDIAEREITHIEFDTLFDFYSYLLRSSNFIADFLEISPFVAEVEHMYWLLFGSKEDQELLKNVIRRSPGSCILCRGDTFIDNMIAKYFEYCGVKVKTGVITAAEKHDTLVGGIFIFQISFGDDLKKECDKIYKNVNEDDLGNIGASYEKLLNKKSKIKLTIIRNEYLSKQMTMKIIHEF